MNGISTRSHLVEVQLYGAAGIDVQLVKDP